MTSHIVATEDRLQPCIKTCRDTREHVQKVLNEYCLQKGGDHADSLHVAMMMDCIEICQTAADFMTRNSPMHTAVCAAAAVICDACADSCASFETDREMLHCADMCRACAQSCRTMGQETFTGEATVTSAATAFNDPMMA